jgi:hypothetical protein
VPLLFRLIVLTTSVVALSLSGSVHYLSDKYRYPQNPSTTMAVVVDVVAVPYILYITWDEYTGKPLGLRSPKAKIRLVLLDLFFIIFESANLALAFGALTDQDGSCTLGNNSRNPDICARVKALCAILMIALIAWSLTFAVSIFRYALNIKTRMISLTVIKQTRRACWRQRGCGLSTSPISHSLDPSICSFIHRCIICSAAFWI